MESPKGSADNEHTAPAGWKKKLIPKKSGTPKNDVVFVAPTGEEFKAKRPLERYLKANPGGPSITEFDWSTGEITPTRRSARISEKVKESPVKTPEIGSTKKSKRVRKSPRDSGDAEIQEAAEKEEEMQDFHQSEDTIKAETGEIEEKEGKGSEVKPKMLQEEKEDEPKTAETNEIAFKAEEKPVVEPEIHPDEGALKEHSVGQNEEKPKDLENTTENGYDEKHLEPVKEVRKVYEGEEVQKAQGMDSSTNHSEAKEAPQNHI